MSVNAQIKAAVDRLAKGRETSLAAYDGGTYDFWNLVDNAEDETYENRCESSEMTSVDTETLLGIGWGGTTLKKWFTLHETYFNTDLGYAPSGTTPALATYLAAVGGWRVPYYAALALHEALPNRTVPAFRVFPKGTLVADEADPSAAGMHKFGRFTGTATWVESAGALGSDVGPAGALCINLGAAQSVGATFRCTNFVAATYKDIALSLSTAAQYTQTVLGKIAIASGVTAGDSSVQVGATTNFTAAEYVLLYEDDDTQEVVKVTSLDAGPTRLTLATNALNSYTTGGFVIPLFSDVAYQSGGSGSGDVDVFALPDRVIGL